MTRENMTKEKQKKEKVLIFVFDMVRKAEKTRTKTKNFRDFCFRSLLPIRNGLTHYKLIRSGEHVVSKIPPLDGKMVSNWKLEIRLEFI
jgi:hypothetical protein